MTTQNVPAKLRKLASAAGIALGLCAAVAASVIVAAPQVSASATFVDHGGRVLSAARVYPIYWGRYWAPGRTASPTPDEITHALRTVLASSYLGGLTQYRAIGSATIRGSRVITTTDPPSQFTDKDVEAFLNALFDAGVLPQDEQAIYVVTIPPGIDSTEIELVGEHNYYQRGGHRVHYAWITDSVALEGASQTTTHEIVETLTDPEGTSILGTPGTCDGERWCEIADICSDPEKLYGVMVAPYWSNIAGHCVIPAPPALGISEHRLPGFTASRSGSALAIPAEGVVPVSGRPTSAETARRSADPGLVGRDEKVRRDAAGQSSAQSVRALHPREQSSIKNRTTKRGELYETYCGDAAHDSPRESSCGTPIRRTQYRYRSRDQFHAGRIGRRRRARRLGIITSTPVHTSAVNSAPGHCSRWVRREPSETPRHRPRGRPSGCCSFPGRVAYQERGLAPPT